MDGRAGEDRLAVAPHGGDGVPAPRVDAARVGEVFRVLADPGLDPDEPRRRVGQIALAAQTGSEQTHVARMATMTGGGDWPQRALLITAIDAQTGGLRVFDHADGISLSRAVAASTALPATAPPITVHTRRYMDGGLRSGTNADLAVDTRTLIVIEPLAHMFAREPLERELAAAAAETVVTINPDPAAVNAFGPDLSDRARREDAYHAGVRQAALAVEGVRGASPAPPRP